MLRQVPPCLHGLLAHSCTSSLHVGPLNPMGQMHLNLFPFGRIEQEPPFLHGEVAHKLDFSQFLPVGEMCEYVEEKYFHAGILPKNPS